MKRDQLKRFVGNADGAVAAIYAIALIPLVAIIGLAYDYTRLVGLDTELQNAADQAALAGASQLDRTSGSMERAIAAIQGGLVSNSTLFSNDGEGTNIDVNAIDICFYSSKPDAEAGDPSTCFTDVTRFAEAGFVQVTVEQRAAEYAFTPVVGAIADDLIASAVAGMGSSLCRIPPLMVCNPDETDRGSGGNPNSTFDIATRRGTGVRVVAGPTGSGPSYWEPGNFGFLDLGAGASAVAEGLGWLTSLDNCIAIEGNETIAPDTEPGLKAGAIDSINTRFDIYQNNSTCKSPGQCPAAFNSRKDLIREAQDTPASSTNACAISSSGWKESAATKYLPSSVAPLPSTTTPYSMGHPRDICHAVSAGGTCTGGRFGDGIWDRDAYFRSHYVRTSTGRNGEAIGTSWTQADWEYNLTHGTDALTTSTPTRYEVYEWEVKREGDLVDGVVVLDPHPVGATGATELKQATPICSQHNGYAGDMKTPDRRVMTVAIVNCTAEGVRGKTSDVQIADWIDVFLVQPSADRGRTSKADIYFEVIRKTDVSRTGAPSGPLVRRDVPYLVR
ncbi:MAG: hypothetical protein APF78_05715 [Sphingomonadales bacterium BRH_c3]|nr:MAG: hypothetical protein APF78_05715 [Sphingomonadales bacterium BRH_c3]